MKTILKCMICGGTLHKDWISLHKKLLDEKAKEYQCIYCLADTLCCETSDLEIKIEEFRESGCTLFK